MGMVEKITNWTNFNHENNFSVSIKKQIEIGTVSGLVGGLAIFLIIFGIDSNLSEQPGTFYKIVGIPIGLQDSVATIFGMIVHMGTAALIGAIFCLCSGIYKRLEIKTPKKGSITGGITGIVVYVAFFLPITLLIIYPSLESTRYNEEGIIATMANIDSAKLIKSMNFIILGSLEMHIVYGIIMGTFCGMALNMEYEKLRKQRSDKKF